ncbi:glycosyltransferase family 87 protein [Nakamurella sp.]|uniref:glycosyltransferase family 87 protein n=1 Tax=Nakamurella sp. TaxID=1869182 RepID=UPI003B3AFEFD
MSQPPPVEPDTPDPDGATDRDPDPADPAGPPAAAVAVAGPELARSASLSPTERVIPTWTDPSARRAADLIGGPMGRHAQVGRNRIITPLRVCLLMAIVILICGWLFKAACIQTGPDGNLDQGGQRPWITACYTDVVPLYGSHELDIGALPYKASWLDNGQVRYMEYPVLTGFWMYFVSGLSHGYVAVAKASGFLPVPLDVGAYFTIGAIALGLLYLWAVASTARLARRRIWDTALMCLSPLLIVHAFTNWDLIPIALTAAAMLAWARNKPVLAGVLFGLGAAAKLYPVLLLGPLLILCLRAGKMREWTRTAVAAAAVWLAVNVPVMLAFPAGWYEFIRLNSERPPEYDSWYFIYATLTGSSIWDKAPGASSPSLVNLLSLLLFALACLAIGWFGLSVRRRPRFAQLAFLVIAAFLLTNKVWSPQYSLWLLPLAVLAVPRWRPLLFWQASEAIVWVLLMLSFAGVSNKGLSIYPFINAALVRDALVLMLVYLVVRDIVRPEKDPIRMAGDDDPTGGVLENAPDRFTVASLPALWRRRSAPRGADAPPAPPAGEDALAPGR